MSRPGIWPLIKLSAVSWKKDYASSMGGALAYYTLFSIAPVLIIVIAVAGFFLGPEAARGEIVGQLRGLLGDDGAAAVQGLLQSASKPEEGLLATITSVLLLLLGATTIFAELQSDLDRIWRAETKPISGLWAFLRARLLSFGMVLGMAFVIIVSLLFSTVIAALGKWWGPMFSESIANVLDLGFSFVLLMAIFAMIYRYVPSTHIPWRDVWVGAAATAVLFAVGKWAIGLYLGKSSVTQGFGPFA
ncbi:MAG TPA: YihY/virulence factor BrkB family protein, partial [Gammaproteobacteria bacterium]